MALCLEGFFARQRKLHINLATAPTIYLAQRTNLNLRLSLTPAQSNIIRLAYRLPDNFGSAENDQHIRLNAAGEWSAELAVLAIARSSSNEPQFNARLLGSLGLAWWNTATLLRNSIGKIEPDRRGIATHKQTSEQIGARAGAARGSGIDLHAIRSYQPGDPLKAIDWKATARQGETLVRVWSEERSLELAVLFDISARSALAAGTLDRFHVGLNVLIKLGLTALTQNDRVSLLAYAFAPVFEQYGYHGISGQRAFNAALSGLQRQSSPSNILLAAARFKDKLARRNLIVIISEIDSPSGNEQLLRAVRFLSPKHLPLIAVVSDDRLHALSVDVARDWQAPWRMLAAQEQISEEQGLVSELRNLGAVVVRRPADQLAAEVLRTYGELRARKRI
jgi:uncharacterized protein (DUF58 family)